MQALVTEIWLFLAGAALVGAGVAWILGRFSRRSQLERLGTTWQTRLRNSQDSWNAKIKAAEQEFDAQLEDKDTVISVLTTDLEAERGRRVAMADELAKRKSDMADLLEEQDLISAKLRRMDERLAVALEDADQLDLEVKRLNTEVGELEHEAESYRLRAHLLEPLEDQVRELEGVLKDRNMRIAELEALEAELAERDAAIAALEAEHAAQLDRRADEATRLRTRIGELEPLAARRDAAEADLAACSDEVRRLEQALAEADDEKTALEEELAARTERAASPTNGPEASNRPEIVHVIDSIRGADPRYGTITPDPRDDLKRIAGVGPVLERTLNSLGIVSYRQIATWNDAEIQRVSGRLDGFHDRIRRDDWVGQARRLHLESYGEHVE